MSNQQQKESLDASQIVIVSTIEELKDEYEENPLSNLSRKDPRKPSRNKVSHQKPITMKLVLVVFAVVFVVVLFSFEVMMYLQGNQKSVKDLKNNEESRQQNKKDYQGQKTSNIIDKTNINIQKVKTAQTSNKIEAKIQPNPQISKEKPSEINQIVTQKKVKEIEVKQKPNSKFNLWEMNRQQKIILYQKFNQIDHTNLTYSLPLSNKDQQIRQVFQKYEQTMQVIQWNKNQLNSDYHKDIDQILTKIHQQKNQIENALHNKYKQQYKNKTGNINQKHKITYDQFFQAIRHFSMNTDLNITAGSNEQILIEHEKKRLEERYHVDQYEELPICLVIPSYKNKQSHRYLKNIESVLHQKYINYKAIITVDGNPDTTAELLGKYLKYRQADPSKFILIHQTTKKGSLENIYYAVHKYCDYNQILMILDGDDQLLGQQVFKMFNAIYQKEKIYLVYTQHLTYYNKNLDIGVSQNYPQNIKKELRYRNYYHLYSQFRSMMSDLFLIQRKQSYLDHNKQFFKILADNAIFYPALEMTCGKNSYYPEVFYWYNANTGINDIKYNKQPYYKKAHNQITNVIKRGKCIEDQLKDLQTLR